MYRDAWMSHERLDVISLLVASPTEAPGTTYYIVADGFHVV